MPVSGSMQRLRNFCYIPDIPRASIFISNATQSLPVSDSTNSSILLIVDLIFQEEGWLMGIKEPTNEKGMFPANFTRPI